MLLREKDMRLIGIDIGTSSVCAVAIEKETGDCLARETVTSDAFCDSEFPFEKIQDTEKIIAIAKGLLDKFFTPDTVSIGVTGQMHGIVYLDRDGRHIGPLYTWQDGRGDEPYRDTTYAEHLGIFAGYGCATDFYNRENGIRPCEAVSFCTIHDYFVMRLVGRKTPLIHTTNAQSFGCFDEKTLSFSYDFHPEVTGEFAIAGFYNNIPVGVAIGDNQASVLSTLTNEDALLLNFGTGSQISIISDEKISGVGIESRPYFEGKYLIVGSALCGGRAYSLLCDFYRSILGEVVDITREEVYNIMQRQLEEEEDIAPLSVDTRFAGTRADSKRRGKIEGISIDNFTPASLTRGVLVGMAEELLDMYYQMGKTRFFAIASGNAIRKNPHLLKIAGERFWMPISVPQHIEEGAYGAALFGAICGGQFKSVAEAQSLIRFQR